MSAFAKFNENTLESLSRILGELITGTQLSNIFETCHITDTSGESTKWKRIYSSLLTRQRQDGCGNNVAQFIRAVMFPGRFIGRSEIHEAAKREVNALLAFDGLSVDREGNFRQVAPASTIMEAEERAQILTHKLQGRRIHPEVIRFCSAELLQDNYFHAVFEATKGLAQRIRDMAGVQGDGAALVDKVFSVEKPLIAFNTLETDSEKSEQTGFAMLLKGCFTAVRNPRAHTPKILWKGEDDAADYFTLISLLHRKLDNLQPKW